MDIEPLRKCHLSQIMEIEEESFPVPWTAAEMAETCLLVPRVSKLVATEDQGRIVIAFSIVCLEPERRVMFNFAVRPEYRFQQVGTTLMNFIQGRDRRPLWFELCEDNTAGHLFLHSLGFRLKMTSNRETQEGLRYTGYSFAWEHARKRS